MSPLEIDPHLVLLGPVPRICWPLGFSTGPVVPGRRLPDPRHDGRGSGRRRGRGWRRWGRWL